MIMTNSTSQINWKVIAVGILRKQDTVLLGLRRSKNKENKDLWEFPGGSVEIGESPQQAMIRELKEELDIEVLDSGIANCLCDYRKEGSRLIVFFYVHKWQGEIKNIYHQKLKWFSFDECISKNRPNINPGLHKTIMNIIKNTKD